MCKKCNICEAQLRCAWTEQWFSSSRVDQNHWERPLNKTQATALCLWSLWPSRSGAQEFALVINPGTPLGKHCRRLSLTQVPAQTIKTIFITALIMTAVGNNLVFVGTGNWNVVYVYERRPCSSLRIATCIHLRTIVSEKKQNGQVCHII